MKTSELIQFFADKEFTDDQGYNLLIADIWSIGIQTKEPFKDQPGESHVITEQDMDQPVAQALIGFFMYQIQQVLFPAIRLAKFDAATGDPGPETKVED
jgi:hypothetical protein